MGAVKVSAFRWYRRRYNSLRSRVIHIPGSIQSHGILLALNSAEVICVASENAGRTLQLPLDDVFGRPLSGALGTTDAAKLHAELASEPLADATRLLVPVALPGEKPGDRESPTEVVAYRTQLGRVHSRAWNSNLSRARSSCRPSMLVCTTSSRIARSKLTVIPIDLQHLSAIENTYSWVSVRTSMRCRL